MKYLLQESTTRPRWWVLTDTENQIVCEFREGAFNDTQKFTPLGDATEYSEENVRNLARAAREMAEWLRENHYEIIFTSPTEIKDEARRNIGEQIRAAREARGYTLRHLATLTGIAHNHISRIEQGRYNVTVDSLALICNALGVRIVIE